jgi:hypothetical protein
MVLILLIIFLGDARSAVDHWSVPQWSVDGGQECAPSTSKHEPRSRAGALVAPAAARNPPQKHAPPVPASIFWADRPQQATMLSRAVRSRQTRIAAHDAGSVHAGTGTSPRILLSSDYKFSLLCRAGDSAGAALFHP